MNLGQPGFFKPECSQSLVQQPRRQDRDQLLRQLAAAGDAAARCRLRAAENQRTRYAAGAVNVLNGNFAYFDSAEREICPEHVMASAALRPGLPMVRIGTDHYWDGGLVSNTPLQHLLENAGSGNMLVFQVDLFSARGPLPRDMLDVLSRQKDIQYSSRTRLVTDYYMRQHAQNLKLKKLLAKLPDESAGRRGPRAQATNWRICRRSPSFR